jgi:methionyl-tRNA formyltransferase
MSIKIVYMGTPEYAKVILEALVDDEDFETILVITQPDRPVGRKRVLTPPPVKRFAIENGLEVFQPKSLKNDEITDKIRAKNPDFIVVAAYGQILPREILDIAPCINLHASLLPKYRGASPVQEAILNGDEFTGVTAMMMEEGLDTGAMLSFNYVKLSENIRVDELMETLSVMAGELITKTLKNYHSLKALPQLDALSSHCKKIKRDDGLIDFSLSAKEVYTRFRAFYRWPDIFFGNGLKLLEISLVDEVSNSNAGEILKIDGDSVLVAFSRGTIKIKTLQPKGKKPMSAKAYLVGRGLRVGDKIL